MRILVRNQFNFSKISFIGLGNMGMNMAANLVKNGNHEVFGYDIDFKKQQLAKKNNITFRKDLKTIMKDANIFILMTPSSKQSKTICQSKQYGIFQHAQKGSFVIDCSTIMPDVGIQLNTQAKQHSMTYVDVPCSGGFVGAKAGTLSFMIGAENQKVFQQVKTICKPMGDKFFNCGRVGGGLMAKVCNNLALGIEMIGSCQALALGVKLGMDPKILSDIMKVSTSRCWSIDTSNPVPGVQSDSPASHDYSHGYFTEWMIKDFNHAITTSKQVNAKLPLGQAGRDMYNKILDQGARSKDFGIIYQYLLNNKI